MQETKIKEIANEFIDWYCEAFGIEPCIIFLIDHCELTKDELIELGFDTIDIDNVIANS